MVELDSGAFNRRYVHPDVADYVVDLCGHNCVHFEIQFWLYSWKFDRFNECIKTSTNEINDKLPPIIDSNSRDI